MKNNIMMHDPFLIQTMVDTYFLLARKEEEETGKPMTVPAFALATGFTRTADIVNTLLAADEGISDYPEESIDLITMGITKLEAYYLEKGLRNKFPHALVKFCLGAYHQVKEPTSGDRAGGAINNIMVVFENGETEPMKITQEAPSELATNQSAPSRLALQPKIQMGSQAQLTNNRPQQFDMPVIEYGMEA